MVPYDNPNPLIYDPESDTVTASQVTVPAEVASGSLSMAGCFCRTSGCYLCPTRRPPPWCMTRKRTRQRRSPGRSTALPMPVGFCCRMVGSSWCAIWRPTPACLTPPPTASPCCRWARWAQLARGRAAGDGRVLLLPYNCELADACVWDGGDEYLCGGGGTGGHAAASASWAMRAAWGCRMGGWYSVRARHGIWWCGIRAVAVALGGM